MMGRLKALVACGHIVWTFQITSSHFLCFHLEDALPFGIHYQLGAHAGPSESLSPSQQQCRMNGHFCLCSSYSSSECKLEALDLHRESPPQLSTGKWYILPLLNRSTFTGVMPKRTISAAVCARTDRGRKRRGRPR